MKKGGSDMFRERKTHTEKRERERERERVRKKGRHKNLHPPHKPLSMPVIIVMAISPIICTH